MIPSAALNATSEIIRIAEMIMSVANITADSLAGVRGAANRKMLTKIINKVQAVMAKNESIRQAIFEWSNTRSSELARSIISASGFGSAIKQLRLEVQKTQDLKNEKIAQLDERQAKLNSILNEANTAYTNSTVGGVAGLINNQDITSSLNNIKSSNQPSQGGQHNGKTLQ